MDKLTTVNALTTLSDDELTVLRAQVDTELASRGITFNVGVLGEKEIVICMRNDVGVFFLFY